MRRVIREQEPPKPSTRLSTLQRVDLTGIAAGRHVDPYKLASMVRGDLDWIVMKALEKDRTRRYQTANELARDMQRHLGSEPVHARPPSQLYRFRRFIKRNKVAFSAALLVAISLLLGVVTSTWQAIRANAALADLRASAPVFAAQARSLVLNERIDEAIEILDSAIKLRPDIVDYLVAKADLLESRCRFSEAAAVYRRVLQLSPGHVRADAHAVLCQNLAAEMSARSKLSRESLMGLFTLMEKEDRSVAERMMVRQLLTGGVLMERWLGAAFGIDAFTADPRYPLHPTTREKLQNFESPANSAEHFGSRIRGFLTPPVTGAYTFWIASDDGSMLFLSKDDSPSSKSRIASILFDGGKDSGWTNYCQWTKFESQRSAQIELEAGKIYYIEALHSQGGYGDHMEVAWQIPGTPKPAIIAGQYLSPWPVDRILETQIGPNTYNPKGPSTDSPPVSPQ